MHPMPRFVLAAVVSWGVFAIDRTVASGQQDVTPSAAAHESRVDDDALRSGRTVMVDSGVGGDLAAAGGLVEVAAPVDGYVLAAGRDVEVGSRVGNDLWAAGRTVSVSGDVADNAWLAGQSVTVLPQARIGDDAYLAGRAVDVLGPIGRNLTVTANELRLGSEIDGSVDARAGSVQLLPGALIRGDLNMSSQTGPELAPGARVMGQITHNQPSSSEGRVIGWFTYWMWMFLAVFVLGGVTLALNAAPIRQAAERLAQHLGSSFLIGLVGVIVVPALAVAVAVTVVAVPLALALLALFGVALMLTSVVVSFRVGGLILSRRGVTVSPYAQLALGALVVSCLAALPWVGWVFGSLALLFGFGALLSALNDWRRPGAPAPA